jgi:hypothetical protein
MDIFRTDETAAHDLPDATLTLLVPGDTPHSGFLPIPCPS